MARLGKVMLLSILSASACFAWSPRWITKDNAYDVENRGTVVEVRAAENADLVIIDVGLEGNLREGAICQVLNPDKTKSQIVIVASDRGRSVGLVIAKAEVRKGAAVSITAN